jgi:hypothetical protein
LRVEFRVSILDLELCLLEKLLLVVTSDISCEVSLISLDWNQNIEVLTLEPIIHIGTNYWLRVLETGLKRIY